MNEHETNCDCGCHGEEDLEMVVTLTLDDDTEVDCTIEAQFPVGDQDYILLMAMDEESDFEPTFFRLIYNGDDLDIANIEDDEEFERVVDAYDELLDDAEFDELVGEDE